MIDRAWIENIDLEFIKPAKTSRDTLTKKTSHFFILQDIEGNVGIGECSPIYGLSPETKEVLQTKLSEVIYLLNHKTHPLEIELNAFPSIRFALETAWLDLQQGGMRKLFPSKFTSGEKGIKINGLIWMDDVEGMWQQVLSKYEMGFRCLKLKIGSNRHEDEIEILRKIRERFGKEIELRLDANGAFSPEDALNKLQAFTKFSIHSIEQPIKAGQIQAMKILCKESPIPIALDEELIGKSTEETFELLEQIQSSYIILKPSLIGGFSKCDDLITMSEKLNIGWWVTSYLESNIGLNAIAQWVGMKNTNLYQGLGTGAIYKNNIESPLYIEGEELFVNSKNEWNLKELLSNV